MKATTSPSKKKSAVVAEQFRHHAGRVVGLAMTKAVHFVTEEEDQDGDLVTTVVRHPVFAIGAKLSMSTMICGPHSIARIIITATGFNPFCVTLVVADMGDHQVDCTALVEGSSDAAAGFLQRLLALE